ncbi:lactate/malate family dehydrogenase [Xylocopilactobacillus apicola]|uniref:L-lactate dehydrogenase n=1 Tax=Xylocopilactobacillus apicola TaxID=2932184 RepID=A0AAU9DVU5_9LACO|nr:L-lactate dehydrogenase [Xylocopilactobacillus apicola]BDR59588.1 L-lactate dehydrogenase [Xylocopilactobacillus apicola]
MARTVGIIGMGHVGATIAHLMVAKGLTDTLILTDSNTDKVNADTLDLKDAASLLSTHTEIINGSISQMKDCDLVIAAVARTDLIKPGETDRFFELKINVPLVKDSAQQLKVSGFHGILLVITNPNDVITGLYQEYTGFPFNKVFGTGTYLDTARLKRNLGTTLAVDPRSITGYMLGEHGDSQFAAWSTVRVAERPFSEFEVDGAQIEEATRFGGQEVFAGKGYTNYAIANAAVSLSEIILSDAKSEAICSHYNKELNSYISTPAIVGRSGVEHDLELPLSESEKEKLQQSAQTIKEKSEQFS